jgi:hypothetical protein
VFSLLSFSFAFLAQSFFFLTVVWSRLGKTLKARARHLKRSARVDSVRFPSSKGNESCRVRKQAFTESALPAELQQRKSQLPKRKRKERKTYVAGLLAA